MPDPVTLGLLATSFLGGMFGNRARKQTSAANQTQTSALSPGATGVNDILLQNIRQRLSAPSALPAGYQESGIRDINNVYDVINRNRAANLTSRGLADSPVAAVTDDKGRGGDIARFVSGLPMVERQMRDADMDMASRLVALQPRTVTSSGTNTTTQPGNMLGGGFGDMASVLAFLYGSGAFGGGGKSSPYAAYMRGI
ncbi:MAG TPA: hypothetical protein VEA16_00700 [Vicinamibacterales bacterium]|nr:hypothetical protein [Vicinamibacterales bacterium]